MRNLSLLIVVLALAGCSGSKPFAKSADPCAAPVNLPDGWMNDQQIEVLWGEDRAALLNCADKVETLSGRKPR